MSVEDTCLTRRRKALYFYYCRLSPRENIFLLCISGKAHQVWISKNLILPLFHPLGQLQLRSDACSFQRCRIQLTDCRPESDIQVMAEAMPADHGQISRFLAQSLSDMAVQPSLHGMREQTAGEPELEKGTKHDTKPSVSTKGSGDPLALGDRLSQQHTVRSRIPTDAAAQEISLIRALLRQKPPEACAEEDADLVFVKKLQAEELRRGSAAALSSKKRSASTLDRYFKKHKP